MGGSTKIDVGIIKADGTSNEQLTNEMHPSGKPSWSYSGKKLAFTSYDPEKGSTPRVYIITLSSQDDTWSEAPMTDSEKISFSRNLLDALLLETSWFLVKQDTEVRVKSDAASAPGGQGKYR